MKLSLNIILFLLLPLSASAQTSPIDSLLETQTELSRIAESRADERVKLLEAFIKKSPDSPFTATAKEMLMRARAAAAENFLKQQRPEPAVEQFRLAFKEAPLPVSDRIFLNLIWAFPASMLNYGYREEAILLMREFEPSFADKAPYLAQMGIFYINAEAAEDAARVLARAVELDPKEHKYQQNVGTAYLMMLRLEDAMAAFQKAVSLEPKEPIAYNRLATLYRGEGAFEDAISLYKKQLEAVPEHDSAHGGLAVTYLLMNKETEAADELGKQLAITPRDYRLFTQMAYIALSRKDYARAARLTDMALAIAPTYAWARIVKANTLSSRKEYDTAEEMLTDALARTAGFPTLHFELIKILLLSENYGGAFEQAERLINITPEGEFEVRLAGLLPARSLSFKTLLDKERKAALGIPESFTSDAQYKLVENFLRFELYLEKLRPRAEQQTESQALGRRQRMEIQVKTLEALMQFLSVNDDRTAFRKMWAAEMLLGSDIALERAADLCIDALKESESATLADGSLRDAPELDRSARLMLFAARAHHLLGRIRFRQNKLDDAADQLRIAAANYEEGAEKRSALWNLAAVSQAAGRDDEALSLYIKGYNKDDENAALQRSLIENLYRKLHGSLEGLDLK